MDIPPFNPTKFDREQKFIEEMPTKKLKSDPEIDGLRKLLGFPADSDFRTPRKGKEMRISEISNDILNPEEMQISSKEANWDRLSQISDEHIEANWGHDL